MPYESLADLKARIGLTGSTDDDLVSRLQTVAEAFIVRHCGQTFDPVPEPIVHAVGRLVAGWLKQVRTDRFADFREVSQEKNGEAFVILSRSLGVPVDALALAGPYRVPPL